MYHVLTSSVVLAKLVLRRAITGHSPNIGELTMDIQAIRHIDAIQHWKGLAETALADSDVKNQLSPHTLSGKIWKMLGNLDSLDGIVSTIDEIAKVRCMLSGLSVELIVMGYVPAQLILRTSLEDLLISL